MATYYSFTCERCKVKSDSMKRGYFHVQFDASIGIFLNDHYSCGGEGNILFVDELSPPFIDWPIEIKKNTPTINFQKTKALLGVITLSGDNET